MKQLKKISRKARPKLSHFRDADLSQNVPYTAFLTRTEPILLLSAPLLVRLLLGGRSSSSELACRQITIEQGFPILDS